MLLKTVKEMLLVKDIKNYFAFISYKLKTYIENIKQGFVWNNEEENGVKENSKEMIPKWFKNNDYKEEIDELGISKEEIDILREKLLEEMKS